jgi:hypothetical protein
VYWSIGSSFWCAAVRDCSTCWCTEGRRPVILELGGGGVDLELLAVTTGRRDMVLLRSVCARRVEGGG